MSKVKAPDLILTAERHITARMTDREYLRWRLNMGHRGEPIANPADAWASRNLARRSK